MFTLRSLLKSEEVPADNRFFMCYSSKRAMVGDEAENHRKYEEADIRMNVGNDGHLSFSDGNNYIYLYPDQIYHLKQVIKVAEQQFDKQ